MVCFSKTILLDLMNQLCSPNPKCISTSGLGSFYFARHYFRNRFFFLFLWVLRCFSSPRSLLIYYFTHIWIVGLFFPTEFPHSEISGYIGYVLLTKAFRSLSRPSSAFGAQAFTLRSQQLNLLWNNKLRITSSKFFVASSTYSMYSLLATHLFPCTTRFFFQIYLNLYSSFKYNFCLTFGFIVYSYEYSSLPFFLEYLIYILLYIFQCAIFVLICFVLVRQTLQHFVDIQLQYNLLVSHRFPAITRI